MGGTIIQSPNYPEEYDNNIDCALKIRLGAEEVVLLEFIAFELQPDWSCDLDFLEIRDGDSHDARFLAKKCDSVVPSNIKSTGNTMYIRFHTNVDDTRRGFRFKVEAGMQRISISTYVSFNHMLERYD